VATIQLPERCYSMDSIHQLLVVATAERKILLFDLKEPQKVYKVNMKKESIRLMLVNNKCHCFLDFIYDKV